MAPDCTCHFSIVGLYPNNNSRLFFDGSPTPLHNPRIESAPQTQTTNTQTRPNKFAAAIFYSGLVITFLLTWWAARKRLIEEEATKAADVAKQLELEKKAEAAPDKIKPVWELARFTLENYFQRNLSQVRQIFYVSVGAMIAGFLIVLLGIAIAFTDPQRLKVAIISSASGVLTQFISLTFMAIYKSTMAQANRYVAVLERINTVGMSVQVLDSMDRGDKDSLDLKNRTRVEIVTLLLTMRNGSNRTRAKVDKRTKAASSL